MMSQVMSHLHPCRAYDAKHQRDAPRYKDEQVMLGATVGRENSLTNCDRHSMARDFAWNQAMLVALLKPNAGID
jgi:hypothetical protein